MTFPCSHDGCFPDTTCALGYLNHRACENWNPTLPQQTDEESVRVPDTSDIPWNGYALGTSDLAILAGRGRPALVGMLGPPDSGKTSLLAFLYMLLLDRGRIGEWLFAGSWTLGAWESVVQYSRWQGEPPPSFPPHTSSAGRSPGILHLALRSQSGELRDVLFTDAPGEWFTQWSRTPTDPTSTGARWVVKHSDALLLLIDSAALADEEKLPGARRAARDLMERVAAETSRPVTVVWTKDDVEAPDYTAQTLHSTRMQFLPQAAVARTTVGNPESIEACFVAALASATSRAPVSPLVQGRMSDDPFLAFRGSNVKN